ncbi:MAG TPA: hypothetical protein DCQ04_02905 [Actinobacteria bacterium]|nr:hypothetical protein [Actinomycetota bacterium]
MKTNRLARTIAVVGLATAGLVGTAGMASASQSVAPPSHKVVSAQENPVQLFAGGVRMHYKNDTDQKIKLTSTAKYPTTVFLDPGMTGSVAGQEVSGTDVYVKVDYLRDGKSVDMWGKNSEIWRPSIGFGDGSNWDRYSVDQSRDKSEGGKDFTVTRNSDGNWTKEFTINVK